MQSLSDLRLMAPYCFSKILARYNFALLLLLASGTTALPHWLPAGYMDTCLSTRWPGISTSLLASMFVRAGRRVKVCACLVSVSPQTGSLSHRSIPHPRGHAHLAALISHDSKVPDFLMKVSLEQTVLSPVIALSTTCCWLIAVAVFCSYLHSDKCGWSQRGLRWGALFFDTHE